MRLHKLDSAGLERFGDQLDKGLRRAGVSHTEAARRLAVDRGTIMRWVNGKLSEDSPVTRLGFIAAVSEWAGVDPSELFGDGYEGTLTERVADLEQAVRSLRTLALTEDDAERELATQMLQALDAFDLQSEPTPRQAGATGNGPVNG